MRSYSRGVFLPGDPGGAPVRGRPARLALLALGVCLTGLAAPGNPIGMPGFAHRATAAPRSSAAPLLGDLSARQPEWHRPAPPPPRARRPRPVVVQHRHLPPAKPWLPAGTGLWIHEWPKTMHGSANATVRRARAYGVRTLYVRTGTRLGGFVGAPVLRWLLPATRGTNIRVVAWDFPTLDHPMLDARRLAAAAWFRAPGRGTPRVAAVAPDIETGAEGARSSGHRIDTYLRTLRRLLPPGMPILAAVPWPSEQRRGWFPYGTIAQYSTALLPMTYWYNRSPSHVTSYSIWWLRRYHRPVFPVGQGFDSRVDAPYLRPSNQTGEATAFFRAAVRAHVTAVSLWSWQTAGAAQWHALWGYRNAFGPHPRHLARHRQTRPARPPAPRGARPPRLQRS